MIQFRNEHMTVFQSALFQTTSTVIQTKDMVLIVDPNWLPGEIERIVNYVNEIKGDRPLYLLFTHGDFDHIIGYKAFPGAITIGSKGLSEHPQKERKLSLIRNFDAEHYIQRGYPVQFPDLDVMVSEDAQQLKVGETALTFYLAPGHTEDGLFTVVEPMGVLIAGDYLSDFELPFIYHSAQAYKQTLHTAQQIMERHSVVLLVPGHGQTATNREEMQRRLDLASRHLEKLIQAVMAKDENAIAALGREHAFPSSFTEECHRENVRIIEKEFAG
ncbi:MBL fold metallo-hydrolase [Paenibacillus sedimenti]|uniref:MBL fold metallo-hydrolase n=1 Tax=Paenibacillus sedimenti TaxID=2770274 RepID=A0A926QLN4_9BACL|nr:MBL fold metallo-hydrolase [Paenibacillus sedimenti]MBD0383815.1 MBL fold metallo-hydrolase [Paenibacillus sedimenti]